MTAEPPGRRRRLRAPREHGQALIDPSLDSIDAQQTVATGQFSTLAKEARRELHDAANDYTRAYRDVVIPALNESTPFFLAGHQPGLFHAGVWFKNFLLSSLATRHGAVGINLVVDNDVLNASAIRVPTGTPSAPRVEAVPFDAAAAGVPYEDRQVRDGELFKSFAQRTSELLRPWIAEPIVNQVWPYARQAFKETDNLGQVLARARHQLEGEWGLQTLEVPLSTIYSQQSFRSFLWPVLQDAARFREAYNASLFEYRAINHVRSRAHPVPELGQEDEWYETPLWIWTTDEPRRRGLFVRDVADGLELTDRAQIHERLPGGLEGALDAWSALEHRGIKIRPRALMTTMYARLVLSDLFLHGVGGAKYDELTDAIIHRYFGIEPPQYLTATATVQLPLDYQRVTGDEVRAAQHEARQLRFRAERYPGDGSGAQLIARKQQLLREIPPRGVKRAWHDEMIRINEALLPLVADQQARLNERAAELAELHRVSRLLGSREFSFCLYPADFLRTLLLDLSRARP